MIPNKLYHSTRKNKKFMMLVSRGKKSKLIHFGAKGYSDYTLHKDSDRKRRYLLRHANENWNTPFSAGSLSRWILWNKPSLHDSVEDFRRRFNLV